MTERLRVLFVCTGNICRSPMAQAMLTHALRERLGDDVAADVESAGTGALAGEPIEPEALTVLTKLGVPMPEFVARDLLAAHVEQADLILTATRIHRGMVVTLVPSAVRRTFTIPEFARLATEVDTRTLPDAHTDFPTRGRELVQRATSRRGITPLDNPQDDDIIDPYMESMAMFERVGGDIRRAIDAIVDRLTGA